MKILLLFIDEASSSILVDQGLASHESENDYKHHWIHRVLGKLTKWKQKMRAQKQENCKNFFSSLLSFTVTAPLFSSFFFFLLFLSRVSFPKSALEWTGWIFWKSDMCARTHSCSWVPSCGAGAWALIAYAQALMRSSVCQLEHI